MPELIGFSRFIRKPDPVYARRIMHVADLDFAQESGAQIGHAANSDKWGVKTENGVLFSPFGDWLLTDGKGDWWPITDAHFRERYKNGVEGFYG
jgi:hypothetical protein